jgi:molybdopterin synthase catalytic subunit
MRWLCCLRLVAGWRLEDFDWYVASLRPERQVQGFFAALRMTATATATATAKAAATATARQKQRQKADPYGMTNKNGKSNSKRKGKGKGRSKGNGMRVEIVDGVIAGEEIVAAMKAGADGAVCVFDGIVRDNTRGRRTLHLDYEAYREMALEQMRGLAAEAVAKFGVRDVALVHRLGRLVVGETSVLVVVASAHRGAAFDACRWLIDTLKKTVPIWKKEQFVDGAVWADGEPFPEGIVVGGGERNG